MNDAGPLPEPAHVELGGSAAERWMNCPGSIRASAGYPNRSSSYAMWGTAAHDVAASCLKHERQPIEFVDRRIVVDAQYSVAGKPHYEEITVDEEMVDAVEVYLDLCRLEGDGADRVYVEHRVDLGPCDPSFPEPMKGTCDYGAFFKDARRLKVIDFKGGANVFVPADTPQLRYYAVGLLFDPLLVEERIDTIELIICQPRSWQSDEKTRRTTITIEELLDWADDVLFPAARRTLEPNAPLNAGDWCQFCPAGADCPERRRVELNNALVAFEPIDAIPAREAMPPPLESLSPDQRARLLEVSDRIMMFLRNFREDCFRRLNEDPSAIPGWKIVGRRGNRRWAADDETTALALLFEIGLSAEDIYHKPKLKSVRQIQYVIERAYRARSHERKALVSQLDSLVKRPQGATTLARDSDPREALIGTDILRFEPIE